VPILLAVIAAPATGVAQRLPGRFHGARVMPSDSARAFQPSYWFEGALIGSAVLGTTGFFIAAGLCGMGDGEDNCHSAAFAGAGAGVAVGAAMGALVGGLLQAKRPRPMKGRPLRAAVIGALVGVLWSEGFVCHTLSSGCGSEEPAFGISSAAIGALTGWLLAQ